MILFYSLIGVIAAVLVIWMYRSNKKIDSDLLTSHKKFIRKLKTDYRPIHFDFDECEFIKMDAVIKVRRHSNFDTGYTTDLNGEGTIEDLEIRRTKIKCHKKNSTHIFVEQYDIDTDTFKIKVYQNKGVNVYLPRDSDLQDYYIDLDFLDA